MSSKIRLYEKVDKNLICRVCGKVLYYLGMGRNSHAKMHVRKNEAYGILHQTPLGQANQRVYYVSTDTEMIEGKTLYLSKMAIQGNI